MKKTIRTIIWLMTAAAISALTACGGDDPEGNGNSGDTPEDDPVVPAPTPSTPEFACGADVSWLTQLEAEGERFYSPDGTEMELMQLLRDHCGVNALRLRVWVNPADGWNNAADVMVKARRAASLGMSLMIDFHFSDTWADPSNQITPTAWSGYGLSEMKKAVSDHVISLLSRLKQENIRPAWIQIGNETTQGMLHPIGYVDYNSDEPSNFANFAALVNAGYDAVKSVLPEAKVIIHLNQGENSWIYNHIIGGLAANNARFDMIGMSFYPSADDWRTKCSEMMDNISDLHQRFGKSIMICEVGMHYSHSDACSKLITEIIKNASSLPIEGVFYWEPEAPIGYNGGYDKGCFVSGKPTAALNPFKNI